jgi:hypothetical protein
MTEVVTAASQAAGGDAREAHPRFEVYDSEFAAAPRLALVAETGAHEGPVSIPGEGALYFTSLPGKVDIPARGTPGAYLKRLALDSPNFPVDPSRLSGSPAHVNMPNGMALGRVGSDGTIWFTDPSHGYRQGFRPEPQIGTTSTALTPVRPARHLGCPAPLALRRPS